MTSFATIYALIALQSCWRNSSSLPRLTSCQKIGVGEKESFKFSEWIVQRPSSYYPYLRFVVFDWPPYSVHRLPISTFFSEFADFLESIVLCQEQLLISGDINIRVDDVVDTDAT